MTINKPVDFQMLATRLPQGDLGGASKKMVVLEREPGTGYAVGTTGKVRVKITAPGNVTVLP